MSSANLKQRIVVLQQRGRDLLDQLLQIQPLLRGSFRQVYTRCGKPNCWCAQSAKGHPHVRLTWSENGQLTTRKVPAQATERVRELTDNYRQFRSLRREALDLQFRLQKLLDKYEQSLIAQAHKPLCSLGFTSKMSPRSIRGDKRVTRQKSSTHSKALKT